MNKKQKRALHRILAAAVLLIALHFVPESLAVRPLLYLAPYLIVGGDVLRKAWKGICSRQVFDENFLMAVATVGSILLGEYTESVAVMLFYQIGELFQSIAVGHSRQSITALMDIRPDYANIEGENGLEQVDPDEVTVGTIIVVQPGEKVPIDGVVTEGTASLDTGALTGESLPRTVQPGDEIISGCVNLSGVLHLRTTKEFGDSTVSKILDLVENASSKKSRSEQFITRFARIYTPAVCYGALALSVLPPVFGLLTGGAANWGDWIYRALTFLVISCPCALVVSIPLSFFAGIGGASRAGVLVKGANDLESLASVRTVVFDKTGTLTKGSFAVEGIHHNQMEEKRLLEYAALAESFSNHPISRSLREAWGGDIDQKRVRDVQEIAGGGVIAQVDGVTVAAGNEKLMAKIGVPPIPCHHTGTIVHIAVDGAYMGHILITDAPKPTSAQAIRELKKNGVHRIVMLTGDADRVAQQVAQELGVDEVHSQLLPGDKVDRVEALLSKRTDREKLAFVGDGINDAPVLSRADVGVAMGALGSDAAIEAADVVLMDDDPLKLVSAMQIARKCMRIVYENIVFAIGIKLLCLLLGALGIANMWAAIFADVGVMILAVLNAIRALSVKTVQRQEEKARV